jgi:hypothetical protein
VSEDAASPANLVLQVVVDGHGIHFELGTETAHCQRSEPVTVDEAEGRLENPAPIEPGSRIEHHHCVPILFMSPIFVPKEQLQEWMKVVATVNPVTYVLEAMRSLTIEGWQTGQLIRGLAVAAALAIAMLAWGTRVARRVTSPN